MSPSSLFGDSMNRVVSRFWEAKRHAEAFDKFLPRRARASGLSATQPRPNPVSNFPHQSEVSKLVPLSAKLAAWKLLSNISPWVERTVGKGYRIQFAYRPPRFNGVVSTSVKPERVHLLTQELQALLDKGAIERVPLPDRESGYYSRYFLVPKKDGGVASNFRSSRVEPLPQNIQVQNVDNQDNCVSDPIGGLVCDNRSQGRILSCRYLSTTQEVPEVRFRGEAYQYRVLPFGLALSPRTYTKCMDAALAPLQLQGIRILNYIDDWLILAQSQELALRHRDVFLSHLKSLGLRLNAKKIILSPAQRTTYLGVVWDSITMRAQLSPARVKSILNALNNIKLGQIVTVHYLQRVLGLMAAASMVIPLGLLHMRSFQLWLRARGFHPRANPQRQIRVTRQGLCTLSMWFRAEYGSQIKYPSSTARRGRFQSGEISYLRRRGQYFMSGP